MLGLSRRTDYALIALGHLVERPAAFVPAREIASTYELPPALLMNLMKRLLNAGFIRSIRGTKGGYQLAANLEERSLLDLIETIEGPVRIVDCAPIRSKGPCHCGEEECRVNRVCPVRHPLQALHHKFVRFLSDVKLSDLLVPGKRIDVPLEELAGIS
jgi:Rrf2 family protein